MAGELYNWTRFWIRRGEDFKLDGAFLADPSTKIGRLLNPNPVGLSSIEPNIRCLVLLGEPGSGKSTEIGKQRRFTEIHTKQDGNDSLAFDLGVYATDQYLCQDVFENPTCQTWLKSSNRFYLFLDSLDEGLLAISTLTRLLAQKLKTLPIERLWLRIACRTAECQSSFEDELRGLYGDDEVGVFELLPLRRKDAELAAETSKLDVSRFMNEVALKGVEAFAAKPVTLNFLLKHFKKRDEPT